VFVDESAQFYALFLQTFAGSTKELSLTENELSLLVSSQHALSFFAPFRITDLMNYAFPVYREISSVPNLYLDEDHLTGEDTLIAVSDDDGNLYLFAQETYREVTGQ
ncbi:MAG: hypothetical protein K2K87_13495, partial [Lachnospiraceae bacterium]|nr:hypothetical protein [Lachnospiraceae bacterium]